MGVPAKRKVPRPERQFDTTQCQSGRFAKLVHRDYFAHCMRWGWASRYLKPGTLVFDVGCGQQAPLAHVLSGTNFVHGGRYVGVDLNKTAKGHGKTWCVTKTEFNFIERWRELVDEYGRPDYVTNFEVIEHMGVEDGAALLSAFHAVCKADTQLILSTPVFNGKAAANHIHEYTVPELQTAIERAGFSVDKRFGTFASYPPLKKVMTPEHSAVYHQLREYHGDDVMSCFIGALYPDHSRNNVWVCSPR